MGTVLRLEEEDLDDEDRAILAEVAKKGYYHGRPKSVACPPPVKIEAPQSQPLSARAPVPERRAEFDDFQKKWDCFDRDDYLEELETSFACGTSGERELPMTAGTSSSDSAPDSDFGLSEKQLELATLLHREQEKGSGLPEFKILLTGDGGVGKTALVRRHTSGEFEGRWVPTSGVQVQTVKFSTNCGDLVFNIWELGFSEKHWRTGCVSDRYLTGSQGAIIMFDVTSRISYRNVPNWLREITQACGAMPIVLVGNKIDVNLKNRQVKPKSIMFHRKRQMQYFDVSMQTTYNFEKPFWWLARRLTNQPDLHLVSQFAQAPWIQLDPEAFHKHEQKLSEAQNVAVGDNSDF